MFGFEILDVVIGLVFVYLLLSLFATALNEYVAAVLTLRGKELAKGLGRLLDDLDEGQALARARDGIGAKLTTQADLLTEQLYNHHLIRPLATRQGWMTRFWRWARRQKGAAPPRLPSYIPARSFALALLDVLGIDRKDASLAALLENSEADTTHESVADAFRAARKDLDAAQAAVRAAENQGDAQAKAAADEALGKARIALSKARLAHVLAILKQESSLDLTEHLNALAGLPNANRLPADLQAQVAGLMTGAQTQLQKLHDGVEVWFNNAMDRVSGAYKRTAQGWLFILGLLIAGCMNADTIDMWRRLQANDELRTAMVRRAEAAIAPLDTLPPDTTRADSSSATAQRPDSTRGAAPVQGVSLQSLRLTATQVATDTAARKAVARDSARLAAAEQARKRYKAARARLDSMELKLGWTNEEAIRIGLLRADPKPSRAATGFFAPLQNWWWRNIEKPWAPKGYHVDFFPLDTGRGWLKLLGLLLTATAISLGAPFWFDLLNKVISIRTAGRSPAERPKSPEADAKRRAERAPK